MRAAIEWIRESKLLVVFPSGKVSSLRFPQLRIADPACNESISRIVRITGARESKKMDFDDVDRNAPFVLNEII